MGFACYLHSIIPMDRYIRRRRKDRGNTQGNNEPGPVDPTDQWTILKGRVHGMTNTFHNDLQDSWLIT